jgi:hypothetical protein
MAPRSVRSALGLALSPLPVLREKEFNVRTIPPMKELTGIISAGVGPIIVISAWGLLCLAFYNRLAAVVTRLRSLHREQLHEQEALSLLRASHEAAEADLVRRQEVLGMLQVQIDSIPAPREMDPPHAGLPADAHRLSGGLLAIAGIVFISTPSVSASFAVTLPPQFFPGG